MDLKNFAAGQTAFFVGDGSYGTHRTHKQPITILHVGRKYVTVKFGAREARFYSEDPRNEYLSEKVSFGWPRYLFPTDQLASDWMERENLIVWLKSTADNPPEGGYSLDQLRLVRKILDGGYHEN